MKIRGALRIRSIDDYVVDYAHYHLFLRRWYLMSFVLPSSNFSAATAVACHFEISEGRRRAAKCVATWPIGALSS